MNSVAVCISRRKERSVNGVVIGSSRLHCTAEVFGSLSDSIAELRVSAKILVGKVEEG